MKNIYKVFLSDARRLAGNVVAIVIIMGLSVIPALYAWFNILSNWDPYGESATSQMNIAVFSEDDGFSYGDLSVNIGDKVISGLESNKTIGWIFSESKEDALESVYSGQCYAALVIPQGFTSDTLSFIGGEIDNPKIEYYENSKKNAIATKITSKVKTTVQQSVNESILSTITELASKSGEAITGETAGGSVIGKVTDKLSDMNESLDTYVSVMNTLSLVTSSATDLVGSTQNLIPSVTGVIESGQSSVAGMQSSVLAGAQTADTISSMVDISLTTISSGLDNLSNQLMTITLDMDISPVISNFSMTSNLASSTFDTLSGLGMSVAENSEVDYAEQIKSAKASYEALQKDLDNFNKDSEKTQEKLEALKNTVSAEIKNCQTAINNLKTSFNYEISPSLDNSVYKIEYSLIETQQLLGNLSKSFPDINSALANYNSTLEAGTDNIVATRDYIIEIQGGLANIISGLEALESDEKYNEVMELFRTDPTMIAEFVTSPIAMETVAFYKIDNYGSAMAPFYTVLGIWVGALILVALIHVKVEEEPELMEVKSWQKFFGRYMVFFLIGQAQTALTVLGDLFYVQIQCPHPVLFWMSSAIISMAFTMIMYGLTYAWGNIGQALAVIIMVIQVAGAGCTFPVEVLPLVFRYIYKYLPFTYAMTALKECVGGMYRHDLVSAIGVLILFFIIFIFVGLVLGIPFRRLNQIIDESKEKSGLMV